MLYFVFRFGKDFKKNPTQLLQFSLPFRKKTRDPFTDFLYVFNFLNDQSFSRFLQNGGKVEKRRVSNINEVRHSNFKNDFFHIRQSCKVLFRIVIDNVFFYAKELEPRSINVILGRSFDLHIVAKVISPGGRLLTFFWK